MITKARIGLSQVLCGFFVRAVKFDFSDRLLTIYIRDILLVYKCFQYFKTSRDQALSASSQTNSYFEYPFGYPDGANSDPNDLIDGFIQFNSGLYADGIGTRSENLSVRVIVGAKGAGKTSYLRRLQQTAKNDKSNFVDIIRNDVLSVDSVLSFHNRFGSQDIVGKWQRVWELAILKAVVSHLFYSESLRPYLSEETIRHLEEQQQFFRFTTPVSIQSQVTDTIHQCKSQHEYQELFDSPRWHAVNHHVSVALRNLPEMFLLVDSLDEYYAQAPGPWRYCQMGLFFATMAFLRDDRFGSKLHLVISLRDHVFSQILNGEHASRYRGDPRIKVLQWGPTAIREFLGGKLIRIDDHVFENVHQRDSKPVEAWLGLDFIRNTRRSIDEDPASYLIRHTRMLPRDLIILANKISKEWVARRLLGNDFDLHSRVRSIVAETSREFASEQLSISANQMSGSRVQKETRLTHVQAQTSLVLEEWLKQIIREIGKEKFAREKADEIRLKHQCEIKEFGDPLNILWQNRLLGYFEPNTKNAGVRYFAERTYSDQILPEANRYSFRACLIDLLSIRRVGTVPIELDQNI